MKKILLLLVSVFCTLSVFGQSRMDYTRVNTVIQVGDTLVVKYQYFKGTDATGADMPDATLYQFDIQYNNKLLSVISNDWQPTSTSAQKAVNTWNGYKFTIDDTKNQTDFDGQYLSWLAGDASYSSNSFTIPSENFKLTFHTSIIIHLNYDNLNSSILISLNLLLFLSKKIIKSLYSSSSRARSR